MAPMLVEVEIIDDVDVEPDETLNIMITILPGFTDLASTGSPATSPITIVDDDGMCIHTHSLTL